MWTAANADRNILRLQRTAITMFGNKVNYGCVKRQRGITLLELMVVVAIVGIISAIAYPSYTQFIVKSKRTASTAVLLQIAARQQQYFMDNKQYATDLSSLGFAASSFMINDDGSPVSSGSGKRTYKITLYGATASAYTVQAIPELGQASHDTDCGTMTLTNAGVKGQSGSGDNCW
jgi:type IV pilus assembly protein PilE